MSHNILNDISKVYLEQVAVDEAKKPNDGNLANNYPPYDKVTRGDIIAGALGQDQMGGKKKKKVKEGFSNWRNDLAEVMDDIEAEKKVEERKNIRNKIRTSAMGSGIKLGEAVENLGGTLLEMVELNEEFIYETVNIATEYFYEMGLNEFGVNILIEELGLEGFVDFVFELSEEYTLNEARRSGRIEPVTAKGTPFKSGKPTGKSLQRLRAQKTERRKSEAKASASKPSGFKSFSQKHAAVADAAKKQPAKKPLKDRIAKGVLGALDAYQKGMERHRAATATAGKALGVVGTGASKFGQGVVSGVRTVGKVAGDIRRVVGEESQLNEKSESEQQQKLFGLALSVKRGNTPRSEVSDAVLKIVDTMSEKKIRDFAKTKHKGLPKKVEANEDLQPTTPKQIVAQKQLTTAQRNLALADQNALQKTKRIIPKQDTSNMASQSGVNLTSLASSYEPEGEQISEEERQDNTKMFVDRFHALNTPAAQDAWEKSPSNPHSPNYDPNRVMHPTKPKRKRKP